MFKVESYKDIFDHRANSYHRAMQMCPNARDMEFHHLLSLADLQAHHSIVDMPSGGGYLAWYLPQYIHALHLETSSEFAKHGQAVTEHPVFLINDHQLPLANHSIDRLVSMAGLHHVDNKLPIYQEIARVLKPKGLAVIADAQVGSKVASFLDECVHRYNPMGHCGLYLSSNTMHEIESCGLEVQHSEVRDYYWQFSTVSEMVSYCQSMFGMTQGCEQEIREGIKQYLGYSEEGSVVKMNWQLQFLRIVKPTATIK